MAGDGSCVGYTAVKTWLYLNAASNSSPVFRPKAALETNGVAYVMDGDTVYVSSPSVADWNNDGRKDLLVYLIEDRAGTNLVSTNLFTINGGITNWYSTNVVVSVTNAYKGLSLLQNQGSDEWPIFTQVVVTTNVQGEYGPNQPLVIDFDGDGKKDVLMAELGGSSGRIRYYRNVGSDDAPVFSGFTYLLRNGSINGGFTDYVGGVGVADWDNDGVLDLLGGHLLDQSTGVNLGGIQWYRGVGTATPNICMDRMALSGGTAEYVVPPDQPFQVALWLRNQGGIATNVQVTMVSSSACFAVTSQVWNVGTVGIGGRFSNTNAPFTVWTAPGTTAGVYQVAFAVQANGGYTVARRLNITVGNPVGTGTGLFHEWWSGSSGTNVAQLTNNIVFPMDRSGYEFMTNSTGWFDEPRDRDDNYGERFAGYFIAPQTGTNYFYIAGADGAELWMSTNEEAAIKTRIATTTGVNYHDWADATTQKSAARVLQAGKRYYIEALHKAGVGIDHVSVGVQYPDGTMERPIPLHRLDPWRGVEVSRYYMTVNEGSNTAVGVRLSAPPTNTVQVTVSRLSGSSSIVIASDTNLIFTPADWDTPQTFSLSMAHDYNWTNESAVFICGAAGWATGRVSVTTVEDDPAPPTALTASDEVYPDHVALNWTAMPFADWYEVWRNTTNNSATAIQIAATIANNSFDDYSVLQGMKYYYWIKSAHPEATNGWSPVDAGSSLLPLITWTNRALISVSGYTRGESLSNFPLLVRLGTNSIPGFSYAQLTDPIGARDLRFIDTNSLTPMAYAYEVEKWNTNGDSYVWVRVPVLQAGGTAFRMYWGNGAATNLCAYTTNGATWSDEFSGVWHMGLSSANKVGDSTVNRNNGTSNNTIMVSGLVGDAQSLNGSNSYVNCGNGASLLIQSNLTLSAWVCPSVVTGQYALVSKWPYSWQWMIAGGTNSMAFTASAWRRANSVITTGCWSQLSVVFDAAADKVMFYQDGMPAGVVSETNTPGAAANLCLGQNNGASYFKGLMDECRVEETARSSNWVWATYMTVMSNAPFISYSSREAGAPAGICTLTVSSSMGRPTPAPGTNSFEKGQVITASVDPVSQGATQFVCSGWTMTGCAPTSGVGNMVAFALTNHAVLFWQWATQYWVNATAADGGSVTGGTGWQFAGSNATLTAVPPQYYRLGSWSGTVPPAQTNSNPLVLTIDAPKSVAASFVMELVTNGCPSWWLGAMGYTNNYEGAALQDYDGDGMQNWAEYRAGTDPVNKESVLSVTGVSPRSGTNAVISWSSVAGKYYTVQRRTNLVASGWVVVSSNIVAIPPINSITDAPAMPVSASFYRVLCE